MRRSGWRGHDAMRTVSFRPAILSLPHHRSSGNSFPNCFKRDVAGRAAALNEHRRHARAIIRLWRNSRVSLKSRRGSRLSANACEPIMSACGKPWPVPCSARKRIGSRKYRADGKPSYSPACIRELESAAKCAGNREKEAGQGYAPASAADRGSWITAEPLALSSASRECQATSP
jgi:hypothetical protein